MLEPEMMDRLLSAARTAQRRAHAPYSKFHVGAAFLTSHGRVVTGCNVENASYGLTMCAERVGIGRIIVEDAGTPTACVVVGPTNDPLTPCGACRQVLAEFNPQMEVYCVSMDGQVAVYTAADLLPAGFSASALDR